MRTMTVEQEKKGLNNIYDFVLEFFTDPDTDLFSQNKSRDDKFSVSIETIAKLLGYDFYVNNFEDIKAAVGGDDSKNVLIDGKRLVMHHRDFITYIWTVINYRLFVDFNIGFTRLIAYTFDNEDRLWFTLAPIEECFAVRKQISTLLAKVNSYYFNNNTKAFEGMSKTWFYDNYPMMGREMRIAMHKYFNKKYADVEKTIDERLSGKKKNNKPSRAIPVKAVTQKPKPIPVALPPGEKKQVDVTKSKEYVELLEKYNQLEKSTSKEIYNLKEENKDLAKQQAIVNISPVSAVNQNSQSSISSDMIQITREEYVMLNEFKMKYNIIMSSLESLVNMK